MPDLVGVGTALVGVITEIVQRCEQRKENAQLLQDLRSFLQDLQDSIQQAKEKAQALRNNSAVWALGALKKDLENAILDANKILNEGYIRSLWDANEIRSSVQALRDRVMMSFQIRLSLATFNVAIEGKQAQDAFQQAMLESCFTTSISLRKELQQLITTALESHRHTIEVAVSTIHSFQPQTSDAEEFFEDVLAALNGLSVQDQDDAASSSSSSTRNDANLLAREVDQSRQNAGIQLDNTSSSATVAQPRHLYPSCLDSARSNRRLLLLSPDGLSCRFRSTAGIEESDNVGAAIADMAVPVHDELRRSTTVFYFEMSIEELDGNNVVGMGFTGLESFHNNLLPGCYPNSCGYHGDHGYAFADGREVQQGGVAGPIAKQGDTMGAGIHHGHKEIFFVLNGALVAVITNTLSGTVLPVVALGSPSAYVKVAFSDSAFRPEQRPSRLLSSHLNIQHSNIVSLSLDGLIAQYIAEPVPPHTIAELPVVSLLANYGACFRHPSQRYYFELTIIDKGVCGRIAIGFANRNFFQANWLPGWYPNSCAYHGDDGNLYFGYPAMSQKFGPTFSSGDTIGAGIDHASSTIFFIKNGKKVGHTSRLRMSCDLYPVIGLHSPDEVVSLNFGQAPFSFDTSIPPNLDIIEQPTRLNGTIPGMCVSLSLDGLTACYIGGTVQVAALMADRAICTFRRSSEVYYFELTVLNRGESGGIAIGFCNQDHFEGFQQPGWYLNSCGYHGNNGKLFMMGDSVDSGATFSTRDVVGAGIDYSTNTIFFAKNGHLVGHITKEMDISYALCPIIGLLSPNEKVQLNFGQAPFSFDTSQLYD